MIPNGLEKTRARPDSLAALTAGFLALCLALGSANAAAAASAVAVEDADRFTDYLYLQLLFREADAPGKTFWSGAVEDGAFTSQAVIGTFLSGQEYQQVVAPVGRMYHATLGRLPEPGGYDYWVNRFRSDGEDLVRIAQLFLESPEAQTIFVAGLSDEEFIEVLYQTALDRSADPEGLAFWLAQIAAGASRSEVVSRVSESAEHRAFIDGTLLATQLANALLGRPATGPELQQAAGEPQATVVDRFLKLGSSVSVAIVGLGDSIRVTNAPVVYLGGVASSKLDVVEVRWRNLSNGASGIAAGTGAWEAGVSLQPGDNELAVTAVNRLGIGASMSSQMTYETHMALYSPLSASRDVAYVNDPQPITFSVGVDPDPEAELVLLRDSGGSYLEVAALRDDGTGPDQLDSDGVYTASVLPDAGAAGEECYRARVTSGQGDSYMSERSCIWVSEHLSGGHVAEAVQIAEDVERRFADADPDVSRYDAAAAVAAALPSAWNVAESGFSDSGAVWWVTARGVLGAYREPAMGEKSAGGGADGFAGGLHRPPISEYLFPLAYLADRSRWQPADAENYGLPLAEGTAGTGGRVLSGDARIISPFIDDPFVPAASFGNDDDYFGAWQTVSSAQSCAAFPAVEVLGDGSTAPTLRDFVSLGSTGYLHISTHGDHYFGDLRDRWNDAWGPGDFLAGSRGLVLLESGVAMGFSPSGNYDYEPIEDDLVAKRIVVSAGGRLLLTPAFFEYYLPSLPRSLVVLSACRTAYDSSLVNAYLRRGAAGVVAFSDTLSTAYAQQTGNTLITSLLGGSSLAQAAADAVLENGAEDGDATPAFLRQFGEAELTLAEKGVANGSFERGAAVAWNGAGARSVISRLGDTLPVDGVYMGVASTSAGAGSASGALQQTLCLPDDATSLAFSWNLFSAEFPGFCDSNFQDDVQVELCSFDGAGQETGCQVLVERRVADFCGATLPSTVQLDGQDTESTGWLAESADVAASAGQRVRLRFRVNDALDRVYDSAILVDGLSVGSD